MLGNTVLTAIEIDASQESTVGKGKRASDTEETVHIKDVCTFSRSQIETFPRVRILKARVQLGMGMFNRLTEYGILSLPAEYHDSALNMQGYRRVLSS
ncbi:hypothetical protein PHMEG_00014418 [Phytophthora megakarya]|uniref:Uncharacterized protein n=1 Tax=Phytophthora megakarya TaxID=4795 RepID=A0A225W4C9_9STRA|nr:hypothetical protein PHMEG_00014418 [Phytophthora megakarya]